MNRTVSAIIILIITVIIVISEFTINTRATQELSDRVYEAEVLSKSGRINEAYSIIDESLMNWENRSKNIMLFSSHNKIDQVDESLHIARTYAESGEADMFTAECNRTRVMLKHLSELEYPHLHNIF